MSTIQLSIFFLLFVGYSCPPWRFVTFFLFLARSVYSSSASFSSNTFQNFPGIFDLLSEVSMFQHHTKLRSKFSTLLFSSLKLSPVCWWKESSSWKLFLPWQFWIYFHVYILHYLLLCYPNMWNIPHSSAVFDVSFSALGWLSRDSHHLSFSTFFHSKPSPNFNIAFNHACSTASSLASSIRSSTYLTVRITCPPILKTLDFLIKIFAAKVE